MTRPAPEEIKSCCATAYQNDAVALLLGDSRHPGGRRLTRRLADALGLAPRERVLDVAAGTGGTALLLAREYGVEADGVDLGEASVAKAAATAAAAGAGGTVRFHAGDAERLPFDDATFDAVVCECAFCTFPDKPTAAAEIARVLRPGGRAGITDITVTGPLDERLAGLAGWVACIADARSADDYTAVLDGAGLRVTRSERHDDALITMIDMIEARLRGFKIIRPSAFTGIDLGTALQMTALARAAATRGDAGYVLMAAQK
ncbi:methyltransferase domain-containing protein [Spirillospora sp. NPDC048819]|uniref:class I SAM-dependent methyltransferase n=1 Tax=Spirillospora sp. NPDC048819 TaxID=3155268 RepID=UPI0033EB8C87